MGAAGRNNTGDSFIGSFRFNPLDGEWARPGRKTGQGKGRLSTRFNPLDGEWARPGPCSRTIQGESRVSIPSTGNGRGRAQQHWGFIHREFPFQSPRRGMGAAGRGQPGMLCDPGCRVSIPSTGNGRGRARTAKYLASRAASKFQSPRRGMGAAGQEEYLWINKGFVFQSPRRGMGAAGREGFRDCTAARNHVSIPSTGNGRGRARIHPDLKKYDPVSIPSTGNGRGRAAKRNLARCACQTSFQSPRRGMGAAGQVPRRRARRGQADVSIPSTGNGRGRAKEMPLLSLSQSMFQSPRRGMGAAGHQIHSMMNDR